MKSSTLADISNASQLFINISVCNAGATSVSLDGVTVKYWYTADGAALAQVAMVDMAPISPVPTATATLFDLSEFRVNADAVLAMKFGATTLAAGACTGSIQLRVYAQGYLCCYAAQSGDYSYMANTALTDNPQITAYDAQGNLIWGQEPSRAPQ